MDSNTHESAGRLWRYALPAVLLLLAIGNLAMTAWVNARLVDLANRPLTSSHAPCEAIPMSLVAANPQCADDLLHAMNITNVHVLPYGSPVPGMDDETVQRLRTLMSRGPSQANVTS